MIWLVPPVRSLERHSDDVSTARFEPLVTVSVKLLKLLVCPSTVSETLFTFVVSVLTVEPSALPAMVCCMLEIVCVWPSTVSETVLSLLETVVTSSWAYSQGVANGPRSSFHFPTVRFLVPLAVGTELYSLMNGGVTDALACDMF